jgi:hypothetical protein
MRAEHPVHFAEPYGFWVLTGHRDVEAAGRVARLSAGRQPLFAQQLRGHDMGRIQHFLRIMDHPYP